MQALGVWHCCLRWWSFLCFNTNATKFCKRDLYAEFIMCEWIQQCTVMWIAGNFFFLNFENRIRQNLRQKHARHIADLRAYYDSEIHSLKQQLEASHKTASSEDLKKINQNLADRYCLSLLVFFLCDMVFFQF